MDWDYLNKVVTTADGKRDLRALRRAYDDVAATIQEKFTIVSFSLRDLVVVFGSTISKAKCDDANTLLEKVKDLEELLKAGQIQV